MVTVAGDKPPSLSPCLGGLRSLRGPGRIYGGCQVTVYEANYYFPGSVKSLGGFIPGDTQKRLAGGRGWWVDWGGRRYLYLAGWPGLHPGDTL